MKWGGDPGTTVNYEKAQKGGEGSVMPCFHHSQFSAQSLPMDPVPRKGCPSPLSGTMQTMVFSTAMSRATSRMQLGVTSVPVQGS
jgi:hypothetical protein